MFFRRIESSADNICEKDMTPPTESALRDAAIRGDGEAWRTLYELAVCEVSRFVRWRCGGRRDWAEDATQDAWLTAAKSLSRFDPAQGSFTGWVCGLAANVVRNRIRGWKRSVGRVAPLTTDVAGHPEVEPDRETAFRVLETLAGLPDRFERALRAKYLDGFSVNDIAERWGETPKAVESLLTRARLAFRENYSPLPLRERG